MWLDFKDRIVLWLIDGASDCQVCTVVQHVSLPCLDYRQATASTIDVIVQRLISSMDAMNLDAFIYPGWGNPPRLIGDLSQAGNTPLGDILPCMLCICQFAIMQAL